MKIVQINQVCGSGSTGKIAVDISRTLESEGVENWILYGYGNSGYERGIKFGGDLNIRSHQVKTRLLGKHGFYSKRATRELVERLEELDPDIVHLHNLHGHYLNVEILADYLDKRQKPVVWTFHDCWNFTGHCAYFDYAGCEKWKTCCHDCPNLREYPRSLIFDRSKESYIDKKRIFGKLKNLTIVTPSSWLAGLVEESFLGGSPVKVVFNGIDLDVFRPTESDFRKIHGIEDKFVILGVASVWDRRKGYDYFLELSRLIDEGEVIALIGLDREQRKNLPTNIIPIDRTESATELAGIYSSADVFVNPTLEDNFPTTNIESLACGTPVVTFRTGGSPEAVDESTGIVVEQGDVVGLLEAVREVRRKGGESFSESCVERAQNCFDKSKQYRNYLDIYREIEGDLV